MKVDLRRKVSALQADFKAEFGVGLRVYKGAKFAPDIALKLIAKEGAGGEITFGGNTKVKSVEKAFQDSFGITVQVEDMEGGLADNEVTLASLLRPATKAPKQNKAPSSSGNSPANPSSKSGPCFVATAVYGDFNDPQVCKLRRYRDETLAASWLGLRFIELYYRFGPYLAKFVERVPVLKRPVRMLIDNFLERYE